MEMHQWEPRKGETLKAPMRRACLIALVLFGLVAGPLSAACGDCCGRAAGPASVAAAVECCGDCAATLERSADPVSLAAGKAALDPAVAAAAAPAPASAFSPDVLAAAPPCVVRVGAAPPVPPLPLRL